MRVPGAAIVCAHARVGRVPQPPPSPQRWRGRGPCITPGTTTPRLTPPPRRGSEPMFADAAALVLARAHLERYRSQSNPVDLATARDTLAAIRPEALSSRDQIDLLIGLGQTLYLGDAFGAGGRLFRHGARARIDAVAPRPAAAARLVGDGPRSRGADAPARSPRAAVRPAGGPHERRTADRAGQPRSPTTGSWPRRGAKAISIARGTPPSPPGSGPRWLPRPRRRCGRMSTGSSCRRSFSSAHAPVPRGSRPKRLHRFAPSGTRQAELEIEAGGRRAEGLRAVSGLRD